MVSWRADWPRYLALSIVCIVCIFAAAVLNARAFHFIPWIQASTGTAPLTPQSTFAELRLGAGLAGLIAGMAAAIVVTIVIFMVHKTTLRRLQLQEGKDAYEGLFEASLDALLVTDINGRIVNANQRVQGIFGYTRDEIVGMPIEHLVPIDLRDLHRVHREHYYATPRTRPMGKGLDLHGRRKDGSEFPVDVSLSPLRSRRELQVLAAVGDITERKQAEEAIRRSEERFRNIFERSPLGLALVHPDYRVIEVNDSFRRMLGYPYEELHGRSPLDVTHPDDREESRRLAQALFRGEIPFYKIEKRYVKKNGEVMWATLTATSIRDREGQFLYSLGMIEDITARKQAEEALRQSEERFRGVFENSPLGLTLFGPDYRIERVNASTCRMLGYSQEELSGLKPGDLTHPDDHQRNMAYVQRLFRGEISSYRIEKRYVKKGGEIMWATLTATSLRDRQGRLLYALGMIEDITARKQAEEALRQSEERFRSVFESSPLGLALIGPDYQLAKVNASLCRMSGYSEAELLALNPFDLTHPDDREESRAFAERLFRGEIPSYKMEKRYVTKNGEIIWATMSATVLRDPRGRLLFGLGMVEDISERKAAQEALRQSEERFRGLVEQGPVGITLMSRDYRLLKVNAALCGMLGYSEAELTGMTALDLTYPDDQQPTVNLVERLFTTEGPFPKLEKRYVKKDGEVIWGNVTSSLIHDPQGKPLYAMGMIEDITERKRAEDSLRTMSQRLSQAVRFAAMSVWEWDPRTNNFVWDDAAFEMAGIPKLVPLPYEQFMAIVHPDDLGKTQAALQKVVAQKRQESVEFRVLRPDGALRHAYAAGGPILDQQGYVTRVVGIVIDITERKRAEDELRTVTQRLSLATRSASMGVWDWDLRTDLAIWDDTMFQLFGIPKTAKVSRDDWAGVFHPEDLPKAQAFQDMIVQKKVQDTAEFRIIRRDGSQRYISVAGGPTLDEHGNVTGAVGIAFDITERKQLEKDLDAAREQAIAAARLSALGMMAGGVAHEVNNPLSIIHAMASDLVELVAKKRPLPPRVVARKSQVIRETAERIARIVKSLRQISREGAADPLRLTPLPKIVAETLEICRAKFKAHGVDLLLPQAIPELSVPCREVQISQALLNLLQNAFDAVLEQDGERWVRLGVQTTAGTSVTLSVVDSGMGIPAQLRSRLMEPFFTTKPVGKGTGLGLSLSKTIAEDHGGSLEYGQEEGHTRFSLTLPLASKLDAA